MLRHLHVATALAEKRWVRSVYCEKRAIPLPAKQEKPVYSLEKEPSRQKRKTRCSPMNHQRVAPKVNPKRNTFFKTCIGV
jgi:hypothetical protein